MANKSGAVTVEQAERFKRLCWPLLPLVVRTARYLSSRHDVADDLAQDTMLKAMRAIDTFTEGTDVRAWLITILRRTHIDRLRSLRSRPDDVRLNEVLMDTVEADSLAEIHDADWHQPQRLLEQFEDAAVIRALQALPEAIRWTLMLVDVEQLEHQRAAEILDVPVGTIKSRAHRGRAMLRDRLYDFAVQRGWVETPDSESCVCPEPVACVPVCEPAHCPC